MLSYTIMKRKHVQKGSGGIGVEATSPHYTPEGKGSRFEETSSPSPRPSRRSYRRKLQWKHLLTVQINKLVYTVKGQGRASRLLSALTGVLAVVALLSNAVSYAVLSIGDRSSSSASNFARQPTTRKLLHVQPSSVARMDASAVPNFTVEFSTDVARLRRRAAAISHHLRTSAAARTEPRIRKIATTSGALFSFPDPPTREFNHEAAFTDYGGKLQIGIFEEEGRKRSILHNFALDQTKEERGPPPLDPENDGGEQEPYYAFDDDVKKNPYNDYDDDNHGQPLHCRRTSWHKDMNIINCNTFHELDLPTVQAIGNMKHVGAGTYRDVYITDFANTGDSVVYKTFGEDAKFKYDDYEYMRMDCIVAERLTSNPLIVDIYGFCGLGHLGEAMPDGDIEEWAIPLEERYIQHELDLIHQNTSDGKLEPFNVLKPSEKLLYSLQMVESVAALHGFKDGVIVHDDIQLSQFLFDPNDNIKLNDFNRAEIMLWDDKLQQYCKYRNNPGQGDWRSPEEYFDYPIDEQIDVWSLANNIYALVTGLYPWFWNSDAETLVHTADVQVAIRRGETGYIDPRWFTDERAFAEQELMKLVQRCWEFKPTDRPTIFEMTTILRRAYEKNQEEFLHQDKEVFIPTSKYLDAKMKPIRDREKAKEERKKRKEQKQHQKEKQQQHAQQAQEESEEDESESEEEPASEQTNEEAPSSFDVPAILATVSAELSRLSGVVEVDPEKPLKTWLDTTDKVAAFQNMLSTAFALKLVAKEYLLRDSTTVVRLVAFLHQLKEAAAKQ